MSYDVQEEIRNAIVGVERLHGWKLFNDYDAECPLECLPIETKKILENLQKIVQRAE